MKTNCIFLFSVFQLCKDVKIRLGYNPWFKSDFVYMARKGFTEDPSVIKYSLMEAHRLKCFLDNILSQISKCESRFELIKFFENDHMRATEKMDFNDKLKFWQTVDLEMYHLTAKITYNEPQADYVLHLLNRVSRKVSEAHNMWPGAYIMVSGTSAIKGLHSFLQDALKKSESAVPKVPEQE